MKDCKSYFIKSLIVSKEKTDGHQRELIKIMRKMKLSKDNEGLFFDIGMGIWEYGQK